MLKEFLGEDVVPELVSEGGILFQSGEYVLKVVDGHCHPAMPPAWIMGL